MKGKPLAGLFAVLLTGTLSARAGLVASTSASTLAQNAPNAAALASPPRTPLRVRLSELPYGQALFDDHTIATTVASELADGFGDGCPNGQLTTLPPPPNSALLAVSGLLSLGAIQLGRNVRKLHLGQLPEWYHEGATQVGHATPLDLEFSLSAMPLCHFEAPIVTGDQGPSPWWQMRLESRDRLDFQRFPPSAAPRGPPGLSA